MRRHRPTLRRCMGWVAALACALGFLAAAEREGREEMCGTPTIEAVGVLCLLAAAYAIWRLVSFGLRHPS
jgi:hypothetical protein